MEERKIIVLIVRSQNDDDDGNWHSYHCTGHKHKMVTVTFVNYLCSHLSIDLIIRKAVGKQ